MCHSKYGRRLAASLGAQDDADLVLETAEDTSEAVHSDDEDEDAGLRPSSRRVVSVTELEASDSDEYNE